ncbi:complement factor B-like [Hyperolius riggenbachi]|uniref:complement factor B-like n=1 Tax=Hyperolius riggenbachi TaxID=752182 RepID=UPI0035A2822D
MLPLLLLCNIAMTVASPTTCDVSKVVMPGMTYNITDSGRLRLDLKYNCPKGKNPHPGPVRTCRFGRWKDEDVKFECRDVECPRPPLNFEGGYFEPRQQRYNVGNVISFRCLDGYKMIGPEKRTCQENGKWSGTTTICDDQEGHCPNPGTPMGTTKIGTDYRIEGTVKYTCHKGLKMFGSEKRTCLEDKTWTGTEPSCRYWYTYDTPGEVSREFSSSLSETIESSDPNRFAEKDDRRLRIIKGGPMNIFIILDASQSVGEENFNTAKQAIEVLIEKISSYDMFPRYSIISFASEAKPVVYLANNDSTDADAVIKTLQDYQYSEHADKGGTNTNAAFQLVYSQMSLYKQRFPEFWKTSNIIILMTDGKYNMGGDPMNGVRSIKHFLNITKDSHREDKLDIYVFGLGDDDKLSLDEINDIASKKRNEQHVFRLQSVQDMKKAFDEMIEEVETFQMCGLSRYHSEDNSKEIYPWIAKISITRSGNVTNCKGSIISRNFILTAAHCIRASDMLKDISVLVGENVAPGVRNVHHHKSFNFDSKKDKHVPKSFDYDLAIIELDKKLDFSMTIRPICLPCTTGTTWALKLRTKAASCDDQLQVLLPEAEEEIKALFITEERVNKFERLNVTIREGTKKQGCLDDAREVPEFKDVVDIRDVVTDNFFCTGGTSPNVEPQTCKGDSGGPLIIQHKNRFVQVGVISWGTKSSCENNRRKKVPTGSRDFHANVIREMQWIADIVQTDLEYLQ